MIDSILQMMGFPKGKKDAKASKGTPAKPAAVVAPEPEVAPAPVPAPAKKTTKKKDAVVASQPPAPAASKKPKASPAKKELAPAAPAAPAVKAKKPKADAKPAPQPVVQVAEVPKPPESIPAVLDGAAQKVVQKVKTVQAAVTQAAQPAVQTVVAAVQAVQQPVKKTAAKAASVAKVVRSPSKLTGMIVPSMQQIVASTAAKASYSSTPPSPASEPVIPAIVKKDTKLANNWKTKPVAELTDAELIAMPDSEYMNDVQLAAFRLKLLALKASILNNAGETTEHLREESSVVPDPADRATIEEEHALELRTRDRERKLLKKIEQSIARIDAGDYGYCDETGEAIGVGRLLARPTATLSLEAQQRRELKQKMFGD
jgi:DnaK suppressor protein